jgi:hypothetical protein
MVPLAQFSSSELASRHAVRHKAMTMDPRHYEDSWEHTSIEELEHIRSPFYDLAKLEHTKEGEESHHLLKSIGQKIKMLSILEDTIAPKRPDEKQAAWTRYADNLVQPGQDKHLLQFPRGQPLQRISAGELFRVAKPSNHWENIRRSKSFIADDYFPPIENCGFDPELQKTLEDLAASGNDDAVAEELLQILPNMDHPELINLGIYLAFAPLPNLKSVWREWELRVTDAMHLLSVKQICQAQWACTQKKPKHTTAFFNKHLFQTMFDKVDDMTVEELQHVMQGFRSKENKPLYMKVRKNLVDRRKTLFPKGDAMDLANTFFMFASSRPRNFGVYRVYADQELEELLAHYEHDLCEAAEVADAESLTRLAQAMYILKTD